ncbi:MAG: c-type cytochrome [Actinobacteria bacterium]|nr:c-type cytochrome [Actinomycetota bacterium]
MSPVFASTQQNLAIAFVVALVLGWGLFLLISVKKSGEAVGDESVTAPNRRPYFDDESLEGPRLERAQKAALACLIVVVFGLPMYWLNEPGRQENAITGFGKRAASRGYVLFQPADSAVPEGNIGHFGCGGCHGVDGEGGIANYTLTDADGKARTVKWKAPALNTVLLRYDEAEVNTVITYGRPNTPMPPWGVAGGGPMNEQQVTDLVAYLKSIQLKPAEARQAAVGADGASLFDQFCSRCHTKGWSYDESEVAGGGAFGPNLTNGATLRQFPNVAKHLELVSLGDDFQKPYGERGVGTGRMPGFGQMLSEAQIRAIVEYERSL